MPDGLGHFKPWGSPEAGSCAGKLVYGGLFCGATLSIQIKFHPGRQEVPGLCVWLGAHLSGTELGGTTFPSATL